MSSSLTNVRPEPDSLLVDIARYVDTFEIHSPDAYHSARYCLMDALGCAIQALDVPECVKLLGPIVPGTIVPHGARVPGTSFRLDPVTAAFNISAMIRWLDFNDTWWAGGHPSDNLGGTLAVADHIIRRNLSSGKPAMTMRELMNFMIKAYEIQGTLVIENGFERVGVHLDATLWVKIASTAVITKMLGGGMDEIVNALSQAFIDGESLGMYRRASAGSRKSWAAADANSRAVRLAMLSVKGEMGYPSAITARTWGFRDVLYRGKPLRLARPFESHVIENIQFKISHPAQRHAQTAIECAVRLNPFVQHRLDDIERVVIDTHELALRAIAVEGPLPNYAARDHCLQ